jgi:hypothetical protein
MRRDSPVKMAAAKRNGSHAISVRNGRCAKRDFAKYRNKISFLHLHIAYQIPCTLVTRRERMAHAAVGAKTRMAEIHGSLRHGAAFFAALLAAAVSLAAVSGSVAQSFSCTPHKSCKQIRSCTEAVYRLRQCGDRARDGDNDGIPCENLCGKTLKQMNDRLEAGL